MYWRHVVASTLTEAEEASTVESVERAKIEGERVGSDRYKDNHMAMIFREGLSFSGFERNKVFFGVDGGNGYADLSDVSGADTEADARATIAADFDDDGDADLFVNAIQRDAHYLFRNDVGDGGNFIKLRLTATAGAPSAI
ncbi:MAG: hypothetical protein AAF488_04425, partial [Planctomycetota bacterium]